MASWVSDLVACAQNGSGPPGRRTVNCQSPGTSSAGYLGRTLPMHIPKSLRVGLFSLGANKLTNWRFSSWCSHSKPTKKGYQLQKKDAHTYGHVTSLVFSLPQSEVSKPRSESHCARASWSGTSLSEAVCTSSPLVLGFGVTRRCGST